MLHKKRELGEITFFGFGQVFFHLGKFIFSFFVKSFEANLNQSIYYALIETRLDERFSNAFWKQNAIYFQGIRANRTKE